MSLASLLHEVTHRGVHVRADGETLRYRAPKGAMTPELLEALKLHKPELLRLLRTLEGACAEVDVSAIDLLSALGPQDLAELEAGRMSLDALRAFALARAERLARERGEIPFRWTEIVHCEGCGPVWLWAGLPQRVMGCPWCLNRAKRLPVPHPNARAGAA